MATKLKSYSTTPGSNNSAPPDGFPEGMLPSAVNNSARETMARLAEWYQDAEWILRNDAITAFTGTTLTITGDVTSAYTANRAIRLDESNSKKAIIVSSTFSSPSTTVTVTGYTIVATPTAVEVGIINTSNNAIVTIAGAQTVTGDKTFTGISTFPGTIAGATPFIFEGAIANDFETSFAITDPTADRTITFPDATGTVAFQGGRLTATRYYTASDTWTKPTGLDFVLVETIGGGGGGGGSGNVNTNGGGGGGGGGFSRKKVSAASLSATETVTIGAGGTAGAVAGSGGVGGTSSFGAHISSTGGAGGNPGAANNAGASGGLGSSGDVNISGNGGGSPSNGNGGSGHGGGSYFGGGATGNHNQSAGTAGGNYGGGGGGGFRDTVSQTGGAGAPGIVIVYEYSL